MLMSQNVRKHAVNEDGNTPPSKRTEVETQDVSNAPPNDSSDTTTSDQNVNAREVPTLKKVIKIRRKPSSHQTVPTNTTFEKVHVS